MEYDNELEYKILVSFLLCEQRERLAHFTESHFADTEARKIYTLFLEQYRRFPSADYAAYVRLLNDSQRQIIMTFINSAMSPEIAESHLDDTIAAFHAAYVQRTLSSAAMEVSMNPHIGLADLHMLTARAEQLSREKRNSAADYLNTYGKKYEFIPTHFVQLDNLLNGGFIKGTLATVGARPSTGKTTFALNIAAHNADKKILFFSIEMTARMLYDRLIADCANVDYRAAGLHNIPLPTVKAVLDSCPNLEMIDDMPCIEDIVETILYEKPDFVIIDFMQIITSRQKFTDNRQRIDYISNSLKMTAKKTDCCILALSQVTRSGKEKPTMSDLKESGGLEQDCDYVILLHRPYVLDKKNQELDPAETNLILDKNKFGSTKEIPYRFDGSHQRFTEESTDTIAHIKKPDDKEEELYDDLPF